VEQVNLKEKHLKDKPVVPEVLSEMHGLKKKKRKESIKTNL
jgi:hypothetical protein